MISRDHRPAVFRSRHQPPVSDYANAPDAYEEWDHYREHPADGSRNDVAAPRTPVQRDSFSVPHEFLPVYINPYFPDEPLNLAAPIPFEL